MKLALHRQIKDVENLEIERKKNYQRCRKIDLILPWL